MLSRRGTSLIEVLIALVLAAIVLGPATGTLLRQQRGMTKLTVAAQSGAQRRAANALLASPLALQTPTTEDIADGEARDTSLQIRAVVASGLACDSSAGPAFVTTDSAGAAIGVANAIGAQRPVENLCGQTATL